jgi:hypothetical protein
MVVMFISTLLRIRSFLARPLAKQGFPMCVPNEGDEEEDVGREQLVKTVLVFFTQANRLDTNLVNFDLFYSMRLDIPPGPLAESIPFPSAY